MQKTKVAILQGGKSAEHEISLLSAKNIIDAIDKDRFEVKVFTIPKEGNWDYKALEEVDVVFPVLHGPNGEDGVMQGFLRMIDKPFVGPDVLGSALAMDKEMAKRILQSHGLEVADFDVIQPGENNAEYAAAFNRPLPVFVKPANMGSSVGVTKVEKKEDLVAAIREAQKYDHKVLIEDMIEGRELECAVLGNEKKEASLVGEVVAKDDSFYSYEEKYSDQSSTEILIPAIISDEELKRIQKVAIKAAHALNLEGMARIDVFLTPSGSVLINEANTIPGFTNISMYPKLWEVSGLSYSDLISRLIELAIERHERDRKIR